MSQAPARFLFKSPDLDVDFEGHPDFVAAQIRFLKERIALAVSASKDPTAAPAAPAPAPTATAPAARTSEPRPASQPAQPAQPVPAATGEATLEQFYRGAKSRRGRGALQETILIFAYFLREHRDKDEFSIENLNACFSLVGATPPRSLANTLGIMKRNQKFFHAGSQRGHYTLAEKGLEYVHRLIGAR